MQTCPRQQRVFSIACTQMLSPSGNDAKSKLLYTTLARDPKIRELCVALMEGLAEPNRWIMQLEHFTKCSVSDLGTNEAVLCDMVDLQEDALLSSVPVTQRAFMLLDQSCEWKLSAQQQVQMREAWHRCEADKLRLLSRSCYEN